MEKTLIRQIVFLGIILLIPVLAFAGDKAIDGKITIDEEKLREVVLDVIRENPKEVLDIINKEARKQKKKSLAERLKSSFKNRIEPIAVDEDTPVKGAKDALITIVEFTDFQCPYCSKGAKTVHKLLEKYPDKVRLALKNNPLDFHDQALPAAKAALAANKQGKFWEYHDLLFENSSKLNEEMFVKFAEDLKLDMEKFNADRNSEAIAEQIEFEQQEAIEKKLKGTPSFVANGVVIRGAQKMDYFVKVVERLLGEMEKKQKKGS